MADPDQRTETSRDSLEELADDGRGTGVEVEKTASDVIREPFDPDVIQVTTRTMTVDLLMSRLKQGVLKLQPDFQRKAGIWTAEKQSRLIESLLLRIPLPSFYVSEDDKDEWEVVDGVQRLTAISRFVGPVHNGAAFPPLKLTGLEYLKQEYHNKYFRDLPPRLVRRIRETEFTFHVIQNHTPDAVRFNIFARLNTGGMPLTHQELRHALVPGVAREVLKEWAEGDSFKRATDRSVKSVRMADREMVLRFLAFWNFSDIEGYSERDFGEFLMNSMKAVNRMNSDQIGTAKKVFETSMDTSFQIFENDAFRKRFRPEDKRNPINRALFECIAVNLASMTPEQRGRLIERRSTVRQKFMALMDDPAFSESVSVSTGDPRNIRLRFPRIRALFEEVSRD